MPFTTGTNASGYQLESISINFRGSGRLAASTSPVYVYLYGDPTETDAPTTADQIATPDEGWKQPSKVPSAGVNKYTVRKYGRHCSVQRKLGAPGRKHAVLGVHLGREDDVRCKWHTPGRSKTRSGRVVDRRLWLIQPEGTSAAATTPTGTA